MRPKFVAGNWKMHGDLATNQSLLAALLVAARADDRARLAVCVPFPYLAQTQQMLRASTIGWGAQDVSEHPSGAYTGEVAASMLRDFGCRYVIVGHSERRTLHGETDARVAAKAAAAVAAGLTPVCCFGETLDERESDATMAVVTRQVRALVARLGNPGMASVVLAYEPVWAIGTGRNATPDQAQDVHAQVRALVAGALSPELASGLSILYGGSVKPANAAALFAMPDIDGGLVGGASLVAAEFLAIHEAARAARAH
jgi:triosephosphate isomerase